MAAKIYYFALLLLTLLIVGCAPKCEEDIVGSSIGTTIKTDANSSSIHYNEDVLSIKVKRSTKENAGDECDVYKRTFELTLVNLTDDVISFSYIINWNGQAEWSYPGTATIQPNATLLKGVIKENEDKTTTGYFTSTISGISYH